MIALLLALCLGLAGDAERAYRAGDYETARKLFEAALSEPGVADGPVLFNLGNCAFRLERHAEAVLWYRRAQLRMPGDRELAFNLALTERRLGIEPAASWPGAAAIRWIDGIPAGSMLLLVTLLQGAGLAGLIALRRGSAARGWMSCVLLLGAVGAVRLVSNAWIDTLPAAVVVVDEVLVRSEPHAGLAISLRLGAGAAVRVAESSDRWVRIVHPRGEGWTERTNLRIVD